MCQDNVKIRDEDDLENGSVENVLKQPLIVRKVLESLDFSTLLQCRLVSKPWGKEATFIMAKQCKISFTSVSAIQDFLDIPSNTETLFVHVVFKFEIEPETKSAPLKTFLKIHGSQLSTVEVPNGEVISGSECVQEWTEKVLSNSTCEAAPAVIPTECLDEKVEVKKEETGPVSEDTPSPEEESSIIPVDENANYVQSEELQEIVISDDTDEDVSKLKQVVSEKEQESTLSSRKLKVVHFSTVENPDYVPIPYNKDGYENFAEFYPYYLGEHSNPAGRRLHVLGVTTTIILIIVGTFTLTPILYAVAILQAYGLAIASHIYYDKHVPRPTIRNPIYMTMGNLKLWWEVASGQRAL